MQERLKWMGFIAGTGGLGFIFGPLIGTVMIACCSAALECVCWPPGRLAAWLPCCCGSAPCVPCPASRTPCYWRRDACTVGCVCSAAVLSRRLENRGFDWRLLLLAPAGSAFGGMPDLNFSWIDLNFMTAPAFFAAVLCIVNSLVIVRSFSQYIVNGPPKAAASPKRGSLLINSRSSTYEEPLLDAKAMGDDGDEDAEQSRVRQTTSFKLVPMLLLVPAHCRGHAWLVPTRWQLSVGPLDSAVRHDLSSSYLRIGWLISFGCFFGGWGFGRTTSRSPQSL